ncbi:MAG: hypothetical protein P4L53_11225, partial [Candidatus Obscuribacterales bacterium]|nr:hypothetical protein [Candidatus Obscuribacterales bacterium]
MSSKYIPFSIAIALLKLATPAAQADNLTAAVTKMSYEPSPGHTTGLLKGCGPLTKLGPYKLDHATASFRGDSVSLMDRHDPGHQIAMTGLVVSPELKVNGKKITYSGMAYFPQFEECCNPSKNKERVYLKDNKSVVGSITNVDTKAVTITTADGTQTIPLDTVADVESPKMYHFEVEGLVDPTVAVDPNLPFDLNVQKVAADETDSYDKRHKRRGAGAIETASTIPGAAGTAVPSAISGSSVVGTGTPSVATNPNLNVGSNSFGGGNSLVAADPTATANPVVATNPYTTYSPTAAAGPGADKAGLPGAVTPSANGNDPKIQGQVQKKSKSQLASKADNNPDEDRNRKKRGGAGWVDGDGVTAVAGAGAIAGTSVASSTGNVVAGSVPGTYSKVLGAQIPHPVFPKLPSWMTNITHPAVPTAPATVPSNSPNLRKGGGGALGSKSNTQSTSNPSIHAPSSTSSSHVSVPSTGTAPKAVSATTSKAANPTRPTVAPRSTTQPLSSTQTHSTTRTNSNTTKHVSPTHVTTPISVTNPPTATSPTHAGNTDKPVSAGQDHKKKRGAGWAAAGSTAAGATGIAVPTSINNNSGSVVPGAGTGANPAVGAPPAFTGTSPVQGNSGLLPGVTPFRKDEPSVAPSIPTAPGTNVSTPAPSTTTPSTTASKNGKTPDTDKDKKRKRRKRAALAFFGVGATGTAIGVPTGLTHGTHVAPVGFSNSGVIAPSAPSTVFPTLPPVHGGFPVPPPGGSGPKHLGRGPNPTTSPTHPTSPTSPTSTTSPTHPTSPTSPTSTTSPTHPTSPTSPTS